MTTSGAGTVDEEHRRDGLASRLSRLHPPTAWSTVDGPLRPRALDANRLPARRDTGVGLPIVLLENDDVRVGWWAFGAGPPAWFLRDADGDLLYLVHTGAGRLETEYGPLAYGPADYLVVPRCTTHRWAAGEATTVLTVEAVGARLSCHSAGVEVPEPEPHDDEGQFTVMVLREGTVTSVTYPHHPLDVVAWSGDLAPLRLPAESGPHPTFTAPNMEVRTVAAGPPEYRRDLDHDEATFYHRGHVFGRAGVTAGTLTFHPAGIDHGPRPEAVVGGDGVAVTVATRRPLRVTDAGRAVEVDGYERPRPGRPG